ncbi:HDIG domain-containing metalloprotein [Muribaculum caecicola]|uniref:HDIG domain-containing protein n=1 Tax=Muribaculum caecicola TaxID=3038144 RepID=A0AC61S5L9_9BACT|nr:HDIG domain-containing metalloprotein [Muribaculum caecicola]THG51971.1 HDIG domain-containing protein [Muribaculum caecicola]
MTDYQAIIDKYYPADASDPESRRIYMLHARQVTNLALALNRERSLGIDPQLLEGAAMLHDIGIFATDAPGIHCFGTLPYLQHGVIGARLLRDENAPEQWALVAERHTGTGITAEDIIQQDMPLPLADYMPVTLLEKLVCYADKFYSKSGTMRKKPIERVRASMARHGSDTLARFQEMYNLFGESDADIQP